MFTLTDSCYFPILCFHFSDVVKIHRAIASICSVAILADGIERDSSLGRVIRATLEILLDSRADNITGNIAQLVSVKNRKKLAVGGFDDLLFCGIHTFVI